MNPGDRVRPKAPSLDPGLARPSSLSAGELLPIALPELAECRIANLCCWAASSRATVAAPWACSCSATVAAPAGPCADATRVSNSFATASAVRVRFKMLCHTWSRSALATKPRASAASRAASTRACCRRFSVSSPRTGRTHWLIRPSPITAQKGFPLRAVCMLHPSARRSMSYGSDSSSSHGCPAGFFFAASAGFAVSAAGVVVAVAAGVVVAAEDEAVAAPGSARFPP
mmetsp:Transcript_50697/g.115136  ORF Transcript_50697/g.115136 Transcript_50697/m.115136 type:complete len:229 (-) Transcript_50697:45-731(-)